MPKNGRASNASRIKLLKFVALFGCGGTERQFVNLGLALDHERFDLRFACMKRWGHFLSEVEDRGIPLREYRIANFYSPRCLRQQWRFARYIAQHRIDIVHAYNFYGNVFALPPAKLASAPVIIASIRDRGVYLSRKQKAVQRYVCRLADCVVVNAESIKDWLLEDGYDPRRIVVIRNGIDLSRFPAGPPRDDLRREFGVPAGAPMIGVVGRLSPMKGIEHLIDAAAIVSRRHPDLRVLIVGEGLVTADGVITEDHAYIEGLKDRVRRLGLGDRVVFTGYRPDVPAVLSQLSLSVQPSLSEGLSNVVLESMAAGVPVVATRVGGTPEVVRHDVTGLLTPPSDPQALAASVERLLDDPACAAALGRAGRQLVEDQFSVPRMVQATEALYEDLLARRRPVRHSRQHSGAAHVPSDVTTPTSARGAAWW